MDSSSVTPANNNSRGDASLAMDADLISVTQTLAKEAYVLFQLGKYVECLKVLNQILEKKTDDPKVLHNIAIVENFQDGFSNPKRFLEALYNLKKRNERLAHSSGENTEAINNRTKALANKANNNVLPHGITADDFDVSVIMFNIAVILYHLHEYEKSFSILERLYQNIEPIDERVARHVCLLLLDVSLVCHHASRAAEVINYLERVGGNTLTNQTDSGTFLQQPTNLVPKSTSAPTNITISDPVDPTNGPESPLSRTLSEETLYESLISTLDIPTPTPTRPPNHLLSHSDDPLITTTPDLRLKVHLYKVYALILTRNLKSAKREVKLAMNIARGKDYSLALYLKSQLEYARQNHRKAIKLLMASLGQTESTSSLYYNNLGCIYYQLQKYQTSALFFSKALQQKNQKEKTTKLVGFSNDKSVLFAYNCGLVYLATNKPVLAVKCFQQAATVFLKKPLLWLRIAECCIMFNETKNEIDVNVIGRGKWRHLVIGRSNSKHSVQVDANLSLTFAKSCLLNALHLLDTGDSNGDAKTNNSNGDAKIGNALLQSSINEYEGLCGKENQMILQAVLADLAFVYLELGNAVKALAAARTLLKLPECSRVYAFLGNVYAAEAYCLLNDPKRASEHLSGYMNSTTELPYSQQDCDMWQTRKSVENDENTPSENQPEMFLKPEVARAVLFANVAAIAAAEGDIDRAEEALGVALTVIPENLEVVLTATYIDLARGKTRDAVGKLKQCSRVRFLNGK